MKEYMIKDRHLLINGKNYLTQRCANDFLRNQPLADQKIGIIPNIELTQLLKEALSLENLKKEELSFLISSLKAMNLDVQIISKTWIVEKDTCPRPKEVALIEWLPGQYLANEVLLHWLDSSPLRIELTPNIAAALPVDFTDIDLLQDFLPGLFDQAQFIYVDHVE